MPLATLRRLRTAISTTSHIAAIPSQMDRRTPTSAPRRKTSCTPKETSITVSEVRNSTRTRRRRENLSATVGSGLSQEVPSVMAPHSGHRAHSPSMPTPHSGQRLMAFPVMTAPR